MSCTTAVIAPTRHLDREPERQVDARSRRKKTIEGAQRLLAHLLAPGGPDVADAHVAAVDPAVLGQRVGDLAPAAPGGRSSPWTRTPVVAEDDDLRLVEAERPPGASRTSPVDGDSASTVSCQTVPPVKSMPRLRPVDERSRASPASRTIPEMSAHRHFRCRKWKLVLSW